MFFSYRITEQIRIKNIIIMKRIALALLTTTLLAFGSNAQDLAINSTDYRTAVGLRAGETSGLTVKRFVGSNDALEGIFGAWYHGFSATVLYERHTQAFNVSGMNWYYGGGAHAAIQSNRRIYRHYGNRYEYYREGSFGLGVDGVLGLEYKIPSTPIAMSLDVKPYIEFINTGGVWTSLDPGLGIKVAF